ncbi:N-acetylmuramoyl-L-alanine amidase [Paraliomyxa miuraensis]|uniref:N-acetylmuramoyl-L-alanine amidase n=1 Tax=Paraliomyxa miuraensis TaxID=376150 RepID=UPI00224F451D|nr:N-acetylmuramoyl-L-alanine amidase [Paraliomyxa miuraensis]MCX4239169.1 N-acetylmuramoyl-L-alanine amidase [Paraliomyxa miuraensis]
MIPLWIPVVGLGALWLTLSKRSGSNLPGGGKIVDRRKHARLTDDAASHTRTRKASDVRALVLHQMGFSRGNDPKRYDGVTAHYVVLPDGGIYWLHDHTTRLPASGGLNSESVAVEFAGNLPSRAGSTNPDAFWGADKFGMDQLEPAQIEGGRALVDALRRQGWLTHIYAHRQGGPNRENDPGPDVWREVGMWAIRKYGLQWGGEGFAVNKGKPIPAHWWGAVA